MSEGKKTQVKLPKAWGTGLLALGLLMSCLVSGHGPQMWVSTHTADLNPDQEASTSS